MPADSAQVPGRDDVRGAERALDRLELVVEQDGEAAVGEVRAERLCVPTYPPPPRHRRTVSTQGKPLEKRRWVEPMSGAVVTAARTSPEGSVDSGSRWP
eukprot:COSAG01_NODE_1518_length_10043_cov_99.027951_1_plen_99_part_00